MGCSSRATANSLRHRAPASDCSDVIGAAGSDDEGLVWYLLLPWILGLLKHLIEKLDRKIDLGRVRDRRFRIDRGENDACNFGSELLDQR